MKIISQHQIGVPGFLAEQCFNTRENFERKYASDSATIQGEQSFHQLNLRKRKRVNHSKNSPANAFSVFSTARRKLDKLSHFSICCRAVWRAFPIAFELAS